MLQKTYNNNPFGLLLGISGYSLFVFSDTIIKKYLDDVVDKLKKKQKEKNKF